MSDQHEGQWDDQRIIAAAEEITADLVLLTDSRHSVARRIILAMQKLRNALRQELAARQWTPVPDGDIHSFLAVQDNGETIAVFVNDDYGYAEEALPDDIRLCRLTPASLQAAVGVAAQEEANDATE